MVSLSKDVSLGDSIHYAPYDAWRKGDFFLDWYGAEMTQGMYMNQSAEGTPMVWTTNDTTMQGYQILNT